MRPRSLSARLARLEAARVAKQQAVSGWEGLACLLADDEPLPEGPEVEAELRAMLADPGTDPGVKSMLKMLLEYSPPPTASPHEPEPEHEDEVGEAENAAFVASLAAELDSRRAAEPPRQEMATIPREPVFPGLDDLDPGPLTPTIRIRNWRRS